MLLLPFGLLGPPASYLAPLLLDGLGATVGAYGLRQLRTAYPGPCLRVRRDSDNAEQDIGFSNKLLDQVTLLTFCGSGNGYVRTWHDQSGLGNHAAQATAGSQPRIVSAGVVETQAGRPCIAQVSDRMALPPGMFAGTASGTAVAVYRQAGGVAGWGHTGSSGTNTHTPYSDNNAYEQHLATSRPAFGPYGDAAAPVVHTASNSGTALSVFRNGTQAGAAQGVTFTAVPDGPFLFGDFGNAALSEALFFASALSAADRQAVERALGAFHGIAVA